MAVFISGRVVQLYRASVYYDRLLLCARFFPDQCLFLVSIIAGFFVDFDLVTRSAIAGGVLVEFFCCIHYWLRFKGEAVAFSYVENEYQASSLHLTWIVARDAFLLSSELSDRSFH